MPSIGSPIDKKRLAALLERVQLAELLQSEADRLDREFGRNSTATLLREQADHLEADAPVRYADLLPKLTSTGSRRRREMS